MNDDAPAATSATDHEIDRGYRHPDEVKETAYQLWAFKLGGNSEKVAAALKISDRTVRDWSQRYEWPIRRYKDWQTIAPDLVRTLGIDLTFGLIETAAEMRRIVTTTETRKVETITPQGSVRTEQVDIVDVKDRIAAGKWIGDNYARLRELGLTTQQPMELTDGNDSPNLALTSEEAYARIMARRERWSTKP